MTSWAAENVLPKKEKPSPKTKAVDLSYFTKEKIVVKALCGRLCLGGHDLSILSANLVQLGSIFQQVQVVLSNQRGPFSASCGEQGAPSRASKVHVPVNCKRTVGAITTFMVTVAIERGAGRFIADR